MWNEVYAPRSPADLVWSRQKQDTLLTTVRGMCTGTQRPRTLLLYGPPGCGKLSSLCVLLHQVASELASAPASHTSEDALGSSSSTTVASSPSSSSKRRSKTSSAGARKGTPVDGPASVSPVPSAGLSALASAALNRSSEFTAVVDHVKLHVYHTCDSVLQRYSHVLRSILLEIVERTETSHATQSGTAEAATPALSADTLRTTSSTGTPLADEASAAVQLTVHIVKLYGERASDALHTYTSAFMRQYEQLLTAATVAHSGVGEPPKLFDRTTSTKECASVEVLARKLRRHLVVFIHTTHDTHSHKVDLNRSLPSVMLQSPACEAFHCTPITAINMKHRVRLVLACEADRRARLHKEGSDYKRRRTESAAVASEGGEQVRARQEVDALFGSSPHGVKRGRSPARGTAQGTTEATAAASLIPTAELDAIIAAGQGDVRQTLLQMQWASLSSCAPPVRAEEATLVALDPHAAVAHMHAATAASTGGKPVTTTTTTTTTTAPVAAPHAAPADDRAPRGSTPSDVILISDSDPEDDPTRQGSAERQTAAAALAPSLSSSVGTSSRPRSVLDLLNDTAEHATEASPVVVVSSPVATPSSSISPSAALDRRHVVPTARDEYLDLSHATARLLTQKYTLDDVTRILNVPPRKLLAYMMHNNLPHYFAPAQMGACATCAEAGSEADALRAMDVLAAGGNFRRHQLASLRTSDDAADGTAVSQMDTMALTLYDRSCRVHHAEVCIPRHFAAMRPAPFLPEAYPRLRDVDVDGDDDDGHGARAGSGAAASWEPRRRATRRRGASSWRAASGHASHAFAELAVSDWSETDWQDAARARVSSPTHEVRLSALWQHAPLGSSTRTGDELSQRLRQDMPLHASATAPTPSLPPILLPDMDILREYLPESLNACGPAEPLVLDYAPYAQYIVFSRPLPSTSGTSDGMVPSRSLSATPAVSSMPPRRTTMFTPPSRGARGAAVAPSGGPRRTTFSFTAAAPAPLPCPTTPTTPPSSRHCSALRVAILQRGLLASAVLRHPPFTVGSDASGDQRDLTSSMPMIPDGDVIEEFSD